VVVPVAHDERGVRCLLPCESRQLSWQAVEEGPSIAVRSEEPEDELEVKVRCHPHQRKARGERRTRRSGEGPRCAHEEELPHLRVNNLMRVELQPRLVPAERRCGRTHALSVGADRVEASEGLFRVLDL
jgi:hypothetical protein